MLIKKAVPQKDSLFRLVLICLFPETQSFLYSQFPVVISGGTNDTDVFFAVHNYSFLGYLCSKSTSVPADELIWQKPKKRIIFSAGFC